MTSVLGWCRRHKALIGTILAASSSALLQVSGAVEANSTAAQTLNFIALVLAGASQGLKGSPP